MADIFLNSGESLALSPFGNSNYFGNLGAESVGLASGVTGVTFSQTIEVVALTGAASSYQFQQSGNQLKVFQTGVLVATITLQGDADGTVIQFADGTASAKVSAAGMTLGGATVPSAAPGTVVPTLTPGGSTPSQTFTLTTDSDQLPGLIGNKGTTDTSGDDLIIAGTSVTGGASVNNLGSGDNVNAGAGFDRLLIIAENTSSFNMLPTLSNTELVDLQNVTTGDDVTLILTNSTGFQQLWAFNTPPATGDDTIFSDIRVASSAVTIGAEDFFGDDVVAIFGATGVDGTVNLAVINSNVDFIIDPNGTINTLNLAATGAASNVVIDIDGSVDGGAVGGAVGTTLNITGTSPSLVVRANDNDLNSLTQVNVTLTGALDIDLGDNDQNVTFNGGPGNTTLVIGDGDNTITTGAGNDSLDIGNGDNVIRTNGGNDVVDITEGGNQDVDLGDGNDRLVGATTFTTADVALNGGVGTDTLSGDIDTIAALTGAATFEGIISNFEIAEFTGTVNEGDNLVVNFNNLDDINNVTLAANLLAGTAVAEVQFIDADATGAYGARLTVEGIEIDVPANLNGNQVADYIVTNFGAQILAAYNSNHGGDTMTGISVANGDELRLDFAQEDGNVALLTFSSDTGTISSGATFGATTTVGAGGTTEVTEQQTITVGTAPDESGFINIGGTQIQVFTGESVNQTATRIRDALDAQKPAGVTSVTVAGNVVTATFDAASANAADLSYSDSAANGIFGPTGTDGADPVIAESRAYEAPVQETQTVVVTGGTDTNGGFLTISDGTDSIDLELDPNLSIDEVGLFIAANQASIAAAIPTLQAIGYDTLTNTLTFQYLLAAGNVAPISLTGPAGNFPESLHLADSTIIDGTDGSASGALLLDNLDSGGTLTLTNTNNGTVTIDLDADTAADVFNVTLTTAYDEAGTGLYDFDDIERINFTTQGPTQEDVRLDPTEQSAVTVTGTVGIDFVNTFTGLTSFDATGISGAASAANKGNVVVTTTASNATFLGGSGNDELTTGSGDDTINGGAGNDLITGGLGAAGGTIGDTLTGGAGDDTFIFNAALESNGVNTDVITDFVAADDTLDLNDGGVNVNVNYLGTANGFGEVQTSLAIAVAGTAVFDVSTNSLYVDVDGDGGLTDADYKIDFSSNIGTTLTNANFA